MVRIDPPPPERPVNPAYLSLPIGERLLRIYSPSPSRWNNNPTSFRRWGGPTQRFDHHVDSEDKSRGIHYSARTLEGCLVEVFADDGFISTSDRRLGSVLLNRRLTLLDLRPEGAWQAGTVASICMGSCHQIAQKWSCHFYEAYSHIDGLVYQNAHNGAVAYALYERAEGALKVEYDIDLSDPRLRSRLQVAAEALNLDVTE